MELKVGQTYSFPGDGERDRTITALDGDVVTYRVHGVLTFVPMQSTVVEFQNWLSGFGSTSKVMAPDGMPQQVLLDAMGLIVKWQDGDEDPQELAVALFELYRATLTAAKGE